MSCANELCFLARRGKKFNKTLKLCYVIGFAPALRFLQSQILCRLYKSPLDETINRGPLLYMHACKKITYACQLFQDFPHLKTWNLAVPLMTIRV